MSEIDDFWAASVAIFATVKHWCDSPSRHEYAERLKERRHRLLKSDQWFLDHGANELADMLPAVLLGGMGVLGFDEWAEKELENGDFSCRFSHSTFAHAVPLFRAANRRSCDDVKRLIERHWASVREGPIKQFLAQYLGSICPDAVASPAEVTNWQSKYDFRLAAAQLAFSFGAIEFIEKKLPEGKPFPG